MLFFEAFSKKANSKIFTVYNSKKEEENCEKDNRKKLSVFEN